MEHNHDVIVTIDIIYTNSSIFRIYPYIYLPRNKDILRKLYKLIAKINLSSTRTISDPEKHKNNKILWANAIKILIDPNQWIINYMGIRYWTSGRPIEDWKNEANHQRGRLFTQSVGDTKGGEKNARGRGWLDAVCNHGLSDRSYRGWRVAKGVCRVLRAPAKPLCRGINTRREPAHQYRGPLSALDLSHPRRVQPFTFLAPAGLHNTWGWKSSEVFWL